MQIETEKLSTTIRVLLVDDHAVVRSGLAAFLLAFSDLELVGEATDGEDAVRLCAGLHPDVVLMDMMMPRMDGATATHLIRERWPQIQVLILTSFKEDALIQNALKAGAIGYLLKNINNDELANAVRAAYRGRLTLASEATYALLQAARQPPVPVPGNNLTERERQVLYLMTKGIDNNAIADMLVVSRSTVKFHVSNILSKLHTTNRTAAVALALQSKLVAQQSLA